MNRHTSSYAAFALALVMASSTAFATDTHPAGAGTPVAVEVTGVDHVGINVPDMDQAVRFFKETFGFEPVTEMKNPPVNADFKKLFNMHPSSSVKSIVMMRAKDGANIELFAYNAPDADHLQPHYDDAGASHIALYVDDIDQAVKSLRGRGVTVLTDPIRMTAGPTAGDTWAYFLTPWGAKMELVSYPGGQAAEVAASTHLWRAQDAGSPASVVELSQKDVNNLVQGYVSMLNDPMEDSRRAFLDKHYTDSTVFNDPEGLVVGRTSLNALLGKLQAAHKGWTFKVVGAPYLQHGNVRVRWQYGPGANPGMIKGEDVVTLSNGRIASTVVFLDEGAH